jgi:hypothetical protein
VPDPATNVEQTGDITHLRQSTTVEEGEIVDDDIDNNMPELIDQGDNDSVDEAEADDDDDELNEEFTLERWRTYIHTQLC